MSNLLKILTWTTIASHTIHVKRKQKETRSIVTVSASSLRCKQGFFICIYTLQEAYTPHILRQWPPRRPSGLITTAATRHRQDKAEAADQESSMSSSNLTSSASGGPNAPPAAGNKRKRSLPGNPGRWWPR